MNICGKPADYAVLVDDGHSVQIVRESFGDLINTEAFIRLFFATLMDMATGVMMPENFIDWLEYEGLIDSEKFISSTRIDMLTDCVRQMTCDWSNKLYTEGVLRDEYSRCNYERLLNDGSVLLRLL